MTASGERKEIALLRSRLEASHTQNMAMHHPSPTTITAVPPSTTMNTKESQHNNSHSHPNQYPDSNYPMGDKDNRHHRHHSDNDADAYYTSTTEQTQSTDGQSRTRPRVTVFKNASALSSSSSLPLPSPASSLPSATPPPPPPEDTPSYHYSLPTPEGAPPMPPDTPGTAPPPPPTPPSDHYDRNAVIGVTGSILVLPRNSYEHNDVPLPPPTPELNESSTFVSSSFHITADTTSRRPLESTSYDANTDGHPIQKRARREE